ncbi:MAG: hypothetical protein V5B36_00900 [Candidatus Accumulibacter sp. UW25]|jgi:hypothetical protein
MINRISRRPLKKKSISYMSPAPVKGLNTADPLASMDLLYALSCINFIATPQGLSLREGYKKWATGLPEVPTTLISYNNNTSTTNKLFAVAGGEIFDVTTGGAVGAPVVTGLSTTNTYWQQANQAGVSSGKAFVGIVNGVDYPRLYDGTSWITCSQVASPAAVGEMSINDSAGNAVDIRHFNDILLHQQRLWFVKNNSTKGYYLDIAQAGGTIYPFDFGSFFPRGGKLWKLASWSTDTNSDRGVNAMLIAISDKGDIAIYKGTSPTDASTWGLVSVNQLGAPISHSCTYNFINDLLYLSREGIYPLSSYIQVGQANNSAAITHKIAPTVSDIASVYSGIDGWQMIGYPGQNLLLLNVPQGVPQNNFQFAFNTVTQGWSQFVGICATSWGLFNERLYFGGSSGAVGDNFVGLAFSGFADGAGIDGKNGNSVVASCLSAFDRMLGVSGLDSNQKNVRLVKPYVITGEVAPRVLVAVNSDFNIVLTQGTSSSSYATNALWDTAIWDDAFWSGSLNNFNKWITPRCYPGEALAISIAVSASTQTLWVGTSWVIEPGRNLM